MTDYTILSDATCDLPAEMAEQLGIVVIPMQFTMSGEVYTHYSDAREMDFHTFFQRTKNGEMSVTSQINSSVYQEYFSQSLAQGKDVLYICFSSALSSTYQSSLLAAEQLTEAYPERKIYCIDSKCAALGEGVLAWAAAHKKMEGMGIDELKDWVEMNRDHVCHWFTVDDLNHLKRGGRVSPVAAVVGTALGIKPILHVTTEGELVPVANARGRKKSLETLVDHMAESCINPEDQTIFIGHGDDRKAAEYVRSLILERFRVKDTMVADLGPIIGSHTGCGFVALFFFGTEK